MTHTKCFVYKQVPWRGIFATIQYIETMQSAKFGSQQLFNLFSTIFFVTILQYHFNNFTTIESAITMESLKFLRHIKLND